MGAVHQVLESHGIHATEEEIAEAMEEALRESGFRQPYPAPRQILEPGQVELLERGGFELDRLEFGLDLLAVEAEDHDLDRLLGAFHGCGEGRKPIVGLDKQFHNFTFLRAA